MAINDDETKNNGLQNTTLKTKSRMINSPLNTIHEKIMTERETVQHHIHEKKYIYIYKRNDKQSTKYFTRETNS